MNSKPGFGTPDLFVSGDYQSKIRLKKKKFDFDFESTSKHAKYIEPKYDDIYGLEPKRDKKFKNKVYYPEFMDKTRKHLQV